MRRERRVMDNFDAAKIFFIYPHIPKGETVIKNIVFNEYEAYKINSHYTIFELLKEFKNPFLFINIDQKMSLNDWSLYMKYISDELEKKDVKFGALTEEIKEIDEHITSNEINLSGGFIDLNSGVDKCTDYILQKLEEHNAKGRRKYIRAKCHEKFHAKFTTRIEGKVQKGYIRDISSAGMACYFDNNIKVPVNTYLDDLQLRLNGGILNISGKVSALQDADRLAHIILFDYRKTFKEKIKLMTFIHSALQMEMQKKIETIESRM